MPTKPPKKLEPIPDPRKPCQECGTLTNEKLKDNTPYCNRCFFGEDDDCQRTTTEQERNNPDSANDSGVHNNSADNTINSTEIKE